MCYVVEEYSYPEMLYTPLSPTPFYPVSRLRFPRSLLQRISISGMGNQAYWGTASKIPLDAS